MALLHPISMVRSFSQKHAFPPLSYSLFVVVVVAVVLVVVVVVALCIEACVVKFYHQVQHPLCILSIHCSIL